MKRSKRTKIIMSGCFAGILCFAVLFLYLKSKYNILSSDEVKVFLSEIESEDIQGAMIASFSFENYQVENFTYPLGIQAVMLDKPLGKGKDLVAVTKAALEKGPALERMIIGLSKDAGDCREELCELLALYPEKIFYLVIDYPSVYETEKLSDTQKEELYGWYYEIAAAFTEKAEIPNVKVFLPAAAKWLVSNTANYEENGEPNKDAAGLVIRQIIGYHAHELTLSNYEEKISDIREIERVKEIVGETDSEYTYVFFGDSVIGNYTDSVSIPGVVSGFTNARVVNCGYGGLAAANGLPEVIDSFMEGVYAHYEEDKAVKNGIKEFYEILPEINQEKLIFFISIGLNDYMSGSELESNQSKDTTSFKGALEYAIEKLQTEYPDSQVIMITPNFLARENFGTDRVNGYTMEELVAIIKEVCEEYDLKCIDIFHELGINAENQAIYLADLCHPNELGRYELGKMIYQNLREWDKENTR